MTENQAQTYAENVGKRIENEERTANDILEEALDINITKNINGHYIGAEIAVTLGGPNAYINTRTQCVEAYWGGQKGYWALPVHVIEELDATLEEISH